MRLSRLRRASACALALALVPGAAFAAATADSTIEVAPRVEMAAPAASPATFPGVTSIRDGRPLPRGWVVESRDVKMTRGGEPAFAAMRMTCPKGKTWRSGTSDGDVGASVLNRNAAGKRSVLVMATYSTRDVRVGETATGTVFALCR